MHTYLSRVSKLILCTAASSLLLAGCWDVRELDRIGIIAALAIDYSDGQWTVSYQGVVPAAISETGIAGAFKLPVVLNSSQAKSIREAIDQSSIENPRQMEFGHMRSVIISRSVAEQGLSPLIDVFLRNKDVRETVSILVTEGEARTVLQQLMQLEIIPGEGIEDMIVKEAKELSKLPNIKMNDLILELFGAAKSGVLPEIVVSGSPGGSDGLKELGKTTTKSKLKLRRLAVLNQDKMVGWLSNQEALGVNFIRNGIKYTSLTAPCHDNSGEGNFTYRMIKNKTSLNPHKEGDHYVIDIDVKGKGVITGTSCQLDYNKPDMWRANEEVLEKQITDLIEKSWEATKKLDTDIVGFADLIKRKYPKEWKQLEPHWEEEFLKIEIRPRVDITLKRVGLATKSFKMQFEEE